MEQEEHRQVESTNTEEDFKYRHIQEDLTKRRQRSTTLVLNIQEWYHQKIDKVSNWVFVHFEVLPLSSNTLLLWNFINYVIIFYSFLSNLFTIFIVSVVHFEVATAQPFHRLSKYSMLMILVIDMLLVRWRVEDVDQLQRRRNHHQAFRRYMAYYFLIDLVVIIVVLMDVCRFKFDYWKLLLYLKVFEYQSIKQQIDVAVNGHFFLQFWYKTIRLLFFVIFWTFFYAAVYVTIQLQEILKPDFYYQNGFSWLSSHPSLKYTNIYQHFQWYVWFQYALFFVMQMVRGAGMGVPSPRSPPSMLWYCISNLTMTIIFVYFTDKVMWVIANYMKKNQFRENLIKLKHMKQIRIISWKDYTKYGRFLKINRYPIIQAWHLQNKLSSMMPELLLRQFNYSLKQHFIMRLTFLNEIIDDHWEEHEFKSNLSQIIRSKIVHQSEVLYKRNRLDSQILYLSEQSHFIISNGQIQYAERLNQWSFVGTRQFFIDKRAHFDVVSSRIAVVEYLEKKEFLEVLKQCPHIRSNYCQLLDSIKIQRATTKSIELECWHCEEYHLTEDCSSSALDKAVLIDRAFPSLRSSMILELQESEDQYRVESELIPVFRTEMVSRKRRGLPHPLIEVDKYNHQGYLNEDYNIEDLQFKRRSQAIISSSDVKTLDIPFLENIETVSIIPLDS